MNFRLNKEDVTSNICQMMKHQSDVKVVSLMDLISEEQYDLPIEERLEVDELAAMIMNFDVELIGEYKELTNELDGLVKYNFTPQKLDLEMYNRETLPTKPCINELLKLEIKDIPSHLWYMFLGQKDTLPVIIVADLTERQVEALTSVLRFLKK